ncbi:hypothetical protein [Phosphitispora sp. TUW77]|uniref:hypothetical protein n=1 Tax=Phosphitispora sp. TUW77 TaxID=3152361 RepID=UPI003AB8FBB8
MKVTRELVIIQLEKMFAGEISREDTGWWAYDLILEENLEYEPGYERLLADVLRSLHYFHDIEQYMAQFYPETEELHYYLKCLRGEEFYQRSRVIHWHV